MPTDEISLAQEVAKDDGLLNLQCLQNVQVESISSKSTVNIVLRID